MKIIFDKSVQGRRGVTLPQLEPGVEAQLKIDGRYLRAQPAELPELSELDVMRHFTALSNRNFGVDSGFYPLGSCTMKYNPKICEKVAALDGFAGLHPFLPQLPQGGELTQGALEVIYELEALLCEISGMAACTLQPLAGAHGELCGMSLIAAYHRDRGNTEKKEILIPDEAHGTNPASAVGVGFATKPVPTDPVTGRLDIEALRGMINDRTAGIMLTNPNTLGIFNSEIDQVVELAHSHDALVYYDGANLNAVLGAFRPGDAGIDVMHINLHKTFATPHGCGGPGSGPVCVRENLVEYLPVSRVVKKQDNTFALDYEQPKSIGYTAPFYGSFLVYLKAYVYILSLGRQGLIEASQHAVLNANYLMNMLKSDYDLPYDRRCMHEFVLSASRQAKQGVHAMDIAKALIDRGFHPPTVYFPLIVKEAIMIEPTETESKETLDTFIQAMKEIAAVANSDPQSLNAAPVNTRISRPDEVQAARGMDFNYCPQD
ncbi:MAG: aminomethyl-transferring glycine dehydrogenase subunit GcvPB [Kiritimatiellae bacterium]|nr:aminomethyl-transferring glycine dehydrogenase subunit GcvPB [Kiritimatiellia bacterium]